MVVIQFQLQKKIKTTPSPLVQVGKLARFNLCHFLGSGEWETLLMA